MDYLVIHPFFSFFTVYVIVTAIIFGLIAILYRRWNAVFSRAAKNEAGIVVDFSKRLMEAEKVLNSLQPRVDVLEAIGKVAVQKVGFKRFNPFDQMGGDQSFALALLDRKNSGVVISSLYTREGVRVYAKEIKNGASKHSLSDEEKEVLEQAVKGQA